MSGFEAIVGAERVRDASGETLDGVPVSRIVAPETAEQVAACLGAAREAKSAVLASGGGSKLARGNPLRASEIVELNLRGLDRRIDVEPEEGIATVAAGARVEDVERAAQAAGMCTVLDAGFPGATVGGTIAVDPPGLASQLDLRLRGDLLGLQVALPSGALTKSGGRVVKNVTGFDLVRLYCGSFGTLGVITEATLRVRPLPEASAVLALDCSDLEAAHEAAAELVTAKVGPSGVALVCGREELRLLWRIEGGTQELADRSGRLRGTPASDEEWRSLRPSVSGTPATDAPVRVRLGGRPSDTLELCRAVINTAGRDALRIALPHAGLVFAEGGEELVEKLWPRAEQERWLFAIERADPALRERFDAFGPAPETLPLMRALKQRFDPDAVLAPGRFLGRI